MKFLGCKNGVYVYAPKKKEGTSDALDRISDVMQAKDIHYVGITSEFDLRRNGYRDLVESLSEKVDFNKYNLILVTIA